MLTFVSRTLASKVDLGCAIIDHTEAGRQCMVKREASGLVAVAVCEKTYPSRVMFVMLRKLLEAFAHVGLTTDVQCAASYLGRCVVLCWVVRVLSGVVEVLLRVVGCCLVLASDGLCWLVLSVVEWCCLLLAVV